MKLLIVLIAVAVLLWLLRSAFRRGPPPPPAPPRAALPMTTCRQCGLHLPRDEALPGKGGDFCGESHRADYERTHPGP